MKKLIFIALIALVGCTKKGDNPCGINGTYLQKETYQSGIKTDSATNYKQIITTIKNNPISLSLVYKNGVQIDAFYVLVTCDKIFDVTGNSFKVGNSESYILFVAI